MVEEKKHAINATQRWFLKQASQPLGCCMDVSHDLVLLFEWIDLKGNPVS